MGLVSAQDKNIKLSSVNSSNIIELKEFNKCSEVENNKKFELLEKGQKEIIQLLATLTKNSSFPPNNKDGDIVENSHQLNDKNISSANRSSS